MWWTTSVSSIFPRTQPPDMSVTVTQAGQAGIVNRMLTSVRVTPAKMEALALMVLTATFVPAHHSGQARSARLHNKVCFSLVCLHLLRQYSVGSLWPVFMCGSECGGVLEGPSGTFSYPNTPGHDQYDHMVSCAWVVRTDADKVSDNIYNSQIKTHLATWFCYEIVMKLIKMYLCCFSTRFCGSHSLFLTLSKAPRAVLTSYRSMMERAHLPTCLANTVALIPQLSSSVPTTLCTSGSALIT